MRKGVPISPSDISDAKQIVIPPEIFDVINELLTLKYIDPECPVYLLHKDILARIRIIRPDFQFSWLDKIVQAYETNGWKVVTQQIGQDTPKFIFSRK